MTLTLSPDTRCLLFPVRDDAPSRNIAFFENKTMVLDVDVCLAEGEPDAVYALDVTRFAGRTLEIRGLPDGVEPTPSATAPQSAELYTEHCRPRLHFSADSGWINDPNGLVWDGEYYHLYFQHNPVGRCWGNMHWGHAVSTDLVHWQQLEGEALHPEAAGTMFSGSGVYDAENCSGLGKGALLFYYTAAGGSSTLSRTANSRFTQCLACSTNGGKTLVKYQDNPVVPHIVDGNRDPKVVWCAQKKLWYMALYLDKNEFALLRSEDLLHWTLFQQFEVPGDAECPDFYPLQEESTGEEYWVFSAAGDRYLVGRLDKDGYFVPVQPVRQLHFGAHSYAAQTYFNTADGARVRIGWCTADLPAMPFNGSMNTPVRMTLRRRGEALCLCAQPIDAFASLRGNAVQPQRGPVGSGCVWQAPDALYEAAWSFVPTDDTTITIGGCTLQLDAAAGVLRHTAGEKEYALPLCADKTGRVTLRAIVDTATLELYTGNGEAFAVFALPAPGTADATVTVQNAAALAQESLTFWPLQPIR